MTHRLATNCAKNYGNRTPIVKVIVENVVTCFLGHSVGLQLSSVEQGLTSHSTQYRSFQGRHFNPTSSVKALKEGG